MTSMEKAGFREALVAAAEAVVAAKDELTRADQAIGDGDHGVGMARGFRAFADAVARLEGADAAACLQAGGKALMMTSGGASGAIFGTFFSASGKAADAAVATEAGSLARAFAAGLEAVKDRGKAKAGDKTMIDAAEPAIEALAAQGEASLSDALPAMAKAAREGMEATRTMVATTGKARALGERSLGHPDPGAMTFTIFCEALAARMA